MVAKTWFYENEAESHKDKSVLYVIVIPAMVSIGTGEEGKRIKLKPCM